MDIVKRLPIWVEQEELNIWLSILDTVWSQLEDEERHFLAAKLSTIRYAIGNKLDPDNPQTT